MGLGENSASRAVEQVRYALRWLPGYTWQLMFRRPTNGPVHLIIALADHFEPSILPNAEEGARAERWVQEQRLEWWCREYPKAVRDWPDSDGRPFRHTYFYPAELYDCAFIDRLSEHCKEGWGEIEIHLHHGTLRPDTPENTRGQLTKFRDALAERGCLSQMDGKGPARYAFVHGNFALANSRNGVACGVDNELQILAETGCYADFTLPSAPNPSQIAKINALYECKLPLDSRAAHSQGEDLKVGRTPRVFPLIVQGPLMLNFARRRQRLFPRIENAALSNVNPPTRERLRLWKRAAITVYGRPDWVFIKLHCHGMDPRDKQALLGSPFHRFLRDLTEAAQETRGDKLHFVSAREMVNIILAGCDGREGNPGDYRDFRLRLRGMAA